MTVLLYRLHRLCEAKKRMTVASCCETYFLPLAVFAFAEGLAFTTLAKALAGARVPCPSRPLGALRFWLVRLVAVLLVGGFFLCLVSFGAIFVV